MDAGNPANRGIELGPELDDNDVVVSLGRSRRSGPQGDEGGGGTETGAEDTTLPKYSRKRERCLQMTVG